MMRMGPELDAVKSGGAQDRQAVARMVGFPFPVAWAEEPVADHRIGGHEILHDPGHQRAPNVVRASRRWVRQ